MYYHRILKNINSIVKKIEKQLRLLTKGLVRAIAQSKKTLGNASNAGFVLPTVTMVMLVVVLLTVAILLRSFDRAEQARNVRVSEQALSAATPALDRARAKLQYLLREDPSLPRGQTPDEDEVDNYLSNAVDERYRFADEERLRVTNDGEEITTAWRFPVDTDNDGNNDSYTIYGIFLATPPSGEQRTPLQARTPPVTVGDLQNENCPAGLSLAGNGWYKNNATSKLVKSFFVYTVTVPDENNANALSPGIAALEYQEDWERVSLSNNAVVYGDDLEISPGPDFRMNGRILTNSNLIVSPFRNDLHLFQVSSDESCFYEAENSKIIVGGNVVNGMSSTNQTNDVDVDLFRGRANGVVETVIGSGNESVDNETAFDTIYNNNAYEKRITVMVNAQMDQGETNDPSTVTIVVDRRMDEEDTTDADRRAEIRREELEIYFRDRTRKVPFAEQPADNPALGVEYDPTYTVIGSGDGLKPPDEWILPDGNTNLDLDEDQLLSREPDDDDDNRPELFLGERILVGNNLPANWWNGSQFVTEQQEDIGGSWVDDAGNLVNPPERTRQPRVTELPSVGSLGRNRFWERAAAQVPEAPLDGIGGLRVITGAGVYERTNSFLPPPVINAWTQAPVDDPATPAPVIEEYTVVWPDTMPMSPSPGATVYDNAPTAGGWNSLPNPAPTAQNPAGGTTIDPNTPQYAKGDLRMRATVVYHYAQDPIDPNTEPADNEQAPIACISSYYDPTNSITAFNEGTLPWNQDPGGRSNNGIVYPPPTTARPGGAIFTEATGLFSSTNPPELAQQANMVFPDGRFANEPLRRALERLFNNGDLTLEEQAAIDSTLCSLEILDGTLTPATTPLDHGVIREVTLLDARQIKAIDADNPATAVDETFTLNSTLANPASLTTNYDLALEERQPLEIRLTQLDLNQMRNQEITFDGSVTTGPSPEYLLPNSGIIYASRDDALPDRSDRTPNDSNDGIDEDASKAISPTDYKLDPTRRPNGIMLINGQSLARNDGNNPVNSIDDVVKEKGLTLVTNLPVYIHGNFNPHTQEEFTQTLADDWGNFYDRTEDQINPNFACRPGDPRLPNCNQGDNWRPATVLADAITLLSDDDDDNDDDGFPNNDSYDNITVGFRPGFRDEGDFDLRNNAGNLPVVANDFDGDNIADAGYDFDGVDADGNGNFLDSSLGLDERATGLNRDLNGDGDQRDIGEEVLGFDLDGRDLDGDGDFVDNALLPEVDITVAGARMLNGFYGNNFVTNGLSSGSHFTTTGTPLTVNEVFYNVNTGNPTDSLGATTTVTPIIDTNYSTTSNANAVNSSYFNNYVTPVQRRGQFPEYVMEICRKLPVSSCQPGDWVVGYDFDTDGLLNTAEDAIPAPQDINGDGNIDANGTEKDLRVSNLIVTGTPSTVNFLGAGTTARPALDPADRHYPRRIAFLRYPNDDPFGATAAFNEQNTLVLDANNVPIPLGIDNAGNVNYYPYSAVDIPLTGGQFSPGGTNTGFPVAVPSNNANALWFRTTTTPNAPTGGDNYGNDTDKHLFYLNPLVVTTPLTPTTLGVGTVQQPLLVPVLQNYVPTNTPQANEANLRNENNERLRGRSRWLTRASNNTTFNLVVGSGDVPPRPPETNGGLQNLPRFLENWARNNNNNFATNITGSFMQLNRSAYATAPYPHLPPNGINNQQGANSLFGYRGSYKTNNYAVDNNGARVGYFLPPDRQWGYDVGLLSQSPDYFSQQLSGEDSSGEPSKYYREVSLDDEWVQTLLCSQVIDTGENAANDNYRQNCN
ncbi:hormogonium polysaccharide biosynthesis protein HpsA [Dapis sp. BLCC M126]|uniref:hormogonium polysaccharide biosynthesis protein HpsA n=1 Tax=Dapis sp. BLCC M126 TaxID=3400189 RepID=UPI003CE932F1